MGFLHYWISPTFSSKTQTFTEIIRKLYRNATLKETPGDPQTLHIAPVDDVIKHYASGLMYISDVCLLEIGKKSITNKDFIKPNIQYASLCLVNLCITSAGFSGDAIKDIVEKVTLLGGTFSRSFNNDVTLVIAAKSASPKVYMAAKTDLPIVKYEWIESCFKHITRIPLDQFRISPFFGCKFTSSDLLSNQRTEIAKIVRKGGGLWSETFDDSVTFLMASSLSNTKKIQLALDDNVPIVQPEWLLHYPSEIISPRNFTLNWWCFNDNETSKLFDKCSFGLSSEIPGQFRRTLVDIILAHNGAYLETPKYYITLDTKRDENHKNSILVTPRWLLSCVCEKRLIDVSESITFSPFSFPREIDGVSGRSFMLLNFNDKRRLELSDLLRSLGATVFYKFTKSANMMVIEGADEHLKSVADEYSIPVVTPLWIMELAKTGKPPAVDKFRPSANSSSVNFRSICNQITRSASKIEGRSFPLETSTIDIDELETFTQISSSDKRIHMDRDVAYDATDGHIDVSTANTGDPFLDALNGS
ncbi:hypothetical protein TRFO_23081 [Tritrichomonas foetus]|uniref:BRCT domain-containing protein n=1 Tax=Tritrichomonas foetus TaxID=1144522 RepID=A0A1J4KB06_9EUKA|nr:hypothetical protein TRFO_23081 [Tritrichomonas foetus]|eukprot:OHT08403.1 hypothetical protein TRFO_23081 [Tritrichomonas foetus]